MVAPRPSFSPNERLRDRGDEHVATRSPTPARPASVAPLAPSAIPSRMISARPRVMIAAAVFSPRATPAALPHEIWITCLQAPPTSVPTTSLLVYGRKYPVFSIRCTATARPESLHATTVAAGWHSAISLAKFGPEITATRDGSTPVTETMT